MICKTCGNEFEYDEGKAYDYKTFECYGCIDEELKNESN